MDNFPDGDCSDLGVVVRYNVNTMLLWRYLTIDSWRRLVDDQRLPLTRIARFEDAFECAVPMLSDGRLLGEAPVSSSSMEIDFYRAAQQRKKWASCWFADEHESIAMWHLYVGNGEPGVAISVLHADLAAAIPNGVDLAPVHYVRQNDSSAEVAHDRPDLWPFIKIWGYRHEREVRVVPLKMIANREGAVAAGIINTDRIDL